MNLILTIVLVVIGFCSCSDDEQIFWNELKALLEAKCNRNPNNDELHDLTSIFEHLSECIDRSTAKLMPFCELYGNSNYYTCLDNFANKISPCLHKEEEYLPNFALTVFNTSLVRTCDKNSSEKINAYLGNLDSSPCLSNYISSGIIQHKECFNDVQHIMQNILANGFVIKKDDLCSCIRSLKSCTIQNLQDQCNEDHTEAVGYILDPYLSQCENVKASNEGFLYSFHTGAALGKSQLSMLQRFFLSGIWILLYKRS